MNGNSNKQKNPIAVPKIESEHAFFPLSTEKSALQFSEAIPVGTYIMKVDGVGLGEFTFLSQRFLDMLDLDRKKALADPNYVYSRVHPDDLEGLREVSAFVQINNLPFYWEGRMVVRGEVRWFLCETNIRKLHNGSVIHEGAVTDITKQKLAELTLREKDKQSLELLRTAPFPMAINNLLNDSIDSINDSFTEMFGYVHSDIPHIRDWAVRAYPDESYRKEVFDWWSSHVSDYLNEGTPIPKRALRIRTKSGRDLDVLITCSLLNNQLILCFLDITDSGISTHEFLKNQEKALISTVELVERTKSQLLAALIALASERDNQTGHHILRTKLYVKCLAERLRLTGQYDGYFSDELINNLVAATPLHDIGKVGVPDSILKKPGRLNADEWEIMKTHTLIGERVLGASADQDTETLKVLEIGIQIAGCHHEKWDGTGYPRGLQGDKIPLPARIMTVADMYDALVSERVYKSAWTHDEAVKEIFKRKGVDLDPLVVDAFMSVTADFQEIAREHRDQ